MDVQPERALEQLLGDQQAVRGDDDRVGGRRVVEALGLETGMPSRSAPASRAWARASAPARGLVGSREQERDLVLRGEPLEHVGAERRGCRDARCASLPEDGCGRSVAIASRRASGVVRSRSAPRRGGRARAGRRVRRARRARGVTGCRRRPAPRASSSLSRSTGTSTPWSERQPSSSRLALLARVDDPRVDGRNAVLALFRAEDETRRRTPTWLPPGRRRSRPPSARASRRRADAGRRRTPRPCARIRSTGSGYWRIRASATAAAPRARRRARSC